MVSNVEGVRHPQPQHVPRSQRAELSYINRGTRNYSDILISHCLSVKWFIHLPQGPHEWHVRQL